MVGAGWGTVPDILCINHVKSLLTVLTDILHMKILSTLVGAKSHYICSQELFQNLIFFLGNVSWTILYQFVPVLLEYLETINAKLEKSKVV